MSISRLRTHIRRLRSRRQKESGRIVFLTSAQQARLRGLWNRFFGSGRYTVAIVAGLLVISLLAYTTSVRGTDVDLYPSVCEGSWYFSDKAAGKPDVAFGAPVEDFTRDNSAVFQEGNQSIICKGFDRGDINDTTRISGVVARFSIAVKKPTVPAAIGDDQINNAAVPAPVVDETAQSVEGGQASEQSDLEIIFEQPVAPVEGGSGEGSGIAPSEEAMPPETSSETPVSVPEVVPVEPAPASEPTPVAPSEPAPAPSSEPAAFRFLNVAYAQDSQPVVETTPVAEPAPVVEPVVSPAPEIIATPETTPVSEALPVSESEIMPVPIAPEQTTPEGEPASVVETPSEPAPIATVVPEAPAVRMGIVSYSFDGTNWFKLGELTDQNWLNLSYQLPLSTEEGSINVETQPITEQSSTGEQDVQYAHGPAVANWQDIDALQFRIESEFYSLAEHPFVYFDGIELHIQYEEGEEEILTQEEIDALPRIEVPASEIFGAQDDDFRVDEVPDFEIIIPGEEPAVTEAVGEQAPVDEGVNVPDVQPIEQSSAPVAPEQSQPTSEPTTFEWLFTDPRQFIKTARAQTPPAKPVRLKVLKADVFQPDGGESEIEPLVEEKNGKLKINVPKPVGSFRPGKYKMHVEILAGDKVLVTDQVFTWGVLAVNTNQGVYTEGDRAYLQMGSLDDEGHTLCKSDLTLEITDPTGEKTTLRTTDKSIVQNSTCGFDNVTDEPDYYSYYQVGEAGEYTMRLMNNNTRYEITDYFEVREELPIELERITATRIYPPATYQVTIRAKAHVDLEGVVYERTPANFVLSETFGEVTVDGDENVIAFGVKMKKGETRTMSYVYDAPDISPYLYLLGPLRADFSTQEEIDALINAASEEEVVNETRGDQGFEGDVLQEKERDEEKDNDGRPEAGVSEVSEEKTGYTHSFEDSRQWQIASDAVQAIGRLFFGQTGSAGTIYFQTRSDGNTWSATTTSTITPTTTNINWLVSKHAPTRNEIMIAALHNSGGLSVTKCLTDCDAAADFTGDTGDNFVIAPRITTSTIACDTTRGGCERPFDLAYEGLSGDALLAYASTTTSGRFVYCTFNGTSWDGSGCGGSSQNTYTVAGVGDIKWIRLIPRTEQLARNATNDILLIAGFAAAGGTGATSTIYSDVWNGTGWVSGAAATTHTITNPSWRTQSFDGAWEATESERAVVVFGATSTAGTTAQASYRTWNGSAWSASTTVGTFEASATSTWIAMAADPKTDMLCMFTQGSSNGISTWRWRSAQVAPLDVWTLGRIDTTGAEGTLNRAGDCAWKKANQNATFNASSSALYIYTDQAAAGNISKFHTWTGNTLGAATAMPGTHVDDVQSFRLFAQPNASTGDTIVAIGESISCDLMMNYATTNMVSAVYVSGPGGTNDSQFADDIPPGCTATDLGTESNGWWFSFKPYSAWTRNWRWYTDASTESVATALANENVSGSITKGSNIRLRWQVQELANVAEVDARKKLVWVASSTCSNPDSCAMKYWQDVDNATDTATVWRYVTSTDASACSAAGCLDGAVVSANKLTGTTQSGTHIRQKATAANANMDYNALAITEVDYHLKAEGVVPGETYFFRMFDEFDFTFDLRKQTTDSNTDCLSAACTYPQISISTSTEVFDGRLFYNDTTDHGFLKVQRFSSLGNWDGEVNTGIRPSPSTTLHLIAKHAPTRNETMIAGILGNRGMWVSKCINDCDSAGDFTIDTTDNFVKNVVASSTTGTTLTCDGTTLGACPRPFDLAYEQLSGDALVVFATSTAASGKLEYCEFNGSVWNGGTNCSSPNQLTIAGSSGIFEWVRLVAQGEEGLTKSRSNRILLTALDKNQDLFSAVWDGSSWGSQTSHTVAAAGFSAQSFNGAWEASSSERALVTYSTGTAGTLQGYWRTWSSTSSAWSASSSIGTFEESSTSTWMMMASDPKSDRICLTTQGRGDGFSQWIWRASSTLTSADTFTLGPVNAAGTEAAFNNSLACAWEDTNGGINTTSSAVFVNTGQNTSDVSAFVRWDSVAGFGANTDMPGSTIDDAAGFGFNGVESHPNSDMMVVIQKTITCDLEAHYWATSTWNLADYDRKPAGGITTGTETLDNIPPDCTASTEGQGYYFLFNPYNAWSRNWAWYSDVSNNTPSTILQAENATTTIATTSLESFVRLRVQVRELAGGALADARKVLQWVASSTCQNPSTCANGNWQFVGDPTEGSAVWRYATTSETCASCRDGGVLSSVLLSSTTTSVAGTYVMDKDDRASTSMDFAALTTTELDYPLKAENAEDGEVYYFRVYDVTDNTVNFPRQDTSIADCVNNICSYPKIKTQAVVASTITVSGRVFGDAGLTGATSTIPMKLAVSSSTAYTTNSDGSGNFTFTSVTQPVAGEILTVWIDGGGYTAATVTRSTSTAGNVSGIDVYRERLIVRHEDTGPLTNTDMSLCDKTTGSACTDADLHFEVTTSTSALAVDSDWALYLWGGKTFTPGGAVTLSPGALANDPGGDIVWASSTATLTLANNVLSIGGDWDNSVSGSLSTGSGQTTTFTATNAGHFIETGGQLFRNLTFDGTNGEWSARTSQMTVGAPAVSTAGNLTMTAGTLNNSVGTSSIVVTNGDVVGTGGTISLTSASFTMQLVATSSADFGLTSGSNNWSFNDLLFQVASSSAGSFSFVTQAGGTGSFTVANNLYVVGGGGAGANNTLNAGSRTWTLSGTNGDPFQLRNGSATADLDSASSTFTFSGDNTGGSTTIQQETYWNFSTGANGETFILEGTTATNNTFGIGNSDIFDLNGSTLSIGGAASIIGRLQGAVDVTANRNITISPVGQIALTAGTFNHTLTAGAMLLIQNPMAASTTFFNYKINSADSTARNFLFSTTAAGSGFTVTNNMTIGDTNTGVVTARFNDGATVYPFNFDIDNSLAVGNVGIFSAGTSTVRIAQNLTVTGTLNPSSSNFIFDTTATSTITGTSTAALNFWNFTSQTGAKPLVFATSTESFRINNIFTLNGTSSNLISVDSSASGTQWRLNHQGTEDISFVTVKDSGCVSTSTYVSVSYANSVDRGNNGFCWLFPSLSATISPLSVNLSLGDANTFTASATNTLTITTNGTLGYSATAFATDDLRLIGQSDTIGWWTGTYSSPTVWTTDCINNSDCGFGYHTNDADITQFTVNEFAAFATSTPGDEIASATGPVTGEETTVTYRASVSRAQKAGDYQTTIRYIITPRF